MVSIVPDVRMSMGGTNEPCAQATLMSFGELGIERNRDISAKIAFYVNHQIGVRADRYITDLTNNIRLLINVLL